MLVVVSRVLLVMPVIMVLARKPLYLLEVITTTPPILGTLWRTSSAGAGWSVAAGDPYPKYQSTTEAAAKAAPRHYGHDLVAGADQHCGVDGERRNAVDHLLLGAVWVWGFSATHREIPRVNRSAHL